MRNRILFKDILRIAFDMSEIRIAVVGGKCSECNNDDCTISINCISNFYCFFF